MNGTPRTAIGGHVHTSSLEHVQADLRSPRSRAESQYPLEEHEEHEPGVEMSLLGNGHPSDVTDDETKDKGHKPLSKQDKNAMTLLIILCGYLVNAQSVSANGRVTARSYSRCPRASKPSIIVYL